MQTGVTNSSRPAAVAAPAAADNVVAGTGLRVRCVWMCVCMFKGVGLSVLIRKGMCVSVCVL